MPLIAMTREMGSLGRDVAAGIAARMGRRVIYHELIGAEANRSRVRKTHVERYLDGESGIWERIDADKTRRAMYTAAETFGLARDEGVGVICSWGAAQLLKGIPHVIRVRICAPLGLRIERMMQRLSTDNRESVAGEIALAESAHASIVRRHFDLDWRNPEEYDLTLSTERFSVESCVDELESLLASPIFRETEASLRQLEALAATDYIGNRPERPAKEVQP